MGLLVLVAKLMGSGYGRSGGNQLRCRRLQSFSNRVHHKSSVLAAHRDIFYRVKENVAAQSGCKMEAARGPEERPVLGGPRSRGGSCIVAVRTTSIFSSDIEVHGPIL